LILSMDLLKENGSKRFWVYPCMGSDLGDLTGLSREEIKRRIQEIWPQRDSSFDARTLITFRDRIEVGDIIVAYKKDNIVAMIGEVVSNYYFDDKNRIGDPNGEIGYANQREVRWWEEPRNFSRTFLPETTK